MHLKPILLVCLNYQLSVAQINMNHTIVHKNGRYLLRFLLGCWLQRFLNEFFIITIILFWARKKKDRSFWAH